MRIFKLAYSNDEAYLRDHLRGGVDIFDYAHQFREFLADNQNDDTLVSVWLSDLLASRGVDDLDDLEDVSIDLFDEWSSQVGEADQDEFKRWIEQNQGDGGYDSPAYEFLDFRGYRKAGWLVHFTDEPESVASDGFIYGHPEIEGVHLTTWKRNRKETGGYNFAFGVEDRNGIRHAVGKYSDSGCVVFWSSGVEAYHRGDEEYQVIFWGPSVNRSMIFPIVRNRDYSNEWIVKNSDSRRIFGNEDINTVIDWVTENWRMMVMI